MNRYTGLIPEIRPRTAVAGSVLATAAAVGAAEAFKLPAASTVPGTMVLQPHGRTHVSQRHGVGPTVVFENGLGTPLTAWSWVAKHLREDIAFYSYDRPGAGWSHSAKPTWNQEYPLWMHDLMKVTSVQPPLILVGHSVGALLIRIYAQQYPELVGGLVFVDPSPPGQHERPDTARGLEVVREQLSRLQVRSLLGLPMPSAYTHSMRLLPEQLSARSVRAMSRHSALRTAVREIEMSRTAWAERAAELTATTVPVAVVTSEAVMKADPGYSRSVDEIAGLSEIHRTVVIDEADHMSMICDRAHAIEVARAIEWVVDRCPLPPIPDLGGSRLEEVAL